MMLGETTGAGTRSSQRQSKDLDGRNKSGHDERVVLSKKQRAPASAW
jgi:hypothetical protein